MFDSFSARAPNVRERSRRVRLDVAIGRCNTARLEHVASRERMDVLPRASVWMFRVAGVGNGG